MSVCAIAFSFRLRVNINSTENTPWSTHGGGEKNQAGFAEGSSLLFTMNIVIACRNAASILFRLWFTLLMVFICWL